MAFIMTKNTHGLAALHCLCTPSDNDRGHYRALYRLTSAPMINRSSAYAGHYETSAEHMAKKRLTRLSSNSLFYSGSPPIRSTFQSVIIARGLPVYRSL